MSRRATRPIDQQLTAARAVLSQLPNDHSGVLFALHHPPADLGHVTIDTIRLRNAGPLATMVEEQPRVIGMLAGHTHAATATTFAGVPLVLAQGVHSDGQLPLDNREPWADLIDESSDPGYAVHLVLGTRLVSYFRTAPANT